MIRALTPPRFHLDALREGADRRHTVLRDEAEGRRAYERALIAIGPAMRRTALDERKWDEAGRREAEALIAQRDAATRYSDANRRFRLGQLRELPLDSAVRRDLSSAQADNARATAENTRQGIRVGNTPLVPNPEGGWTIPSGVAPTIDILTGVGETNTAVGTGLADIAAGLNAPTKEELSNTETIQKIARQADANDRVEQSVLARFADPIKAVRDVETRIYNRITGPGTKGQFLDTALKRAKVDVLSIPNMKHASDAEREQAISKRALDILMKDERHKLPAWLANELTIAEANARNTFEELMRDPRAGGASGLDWVRLQMRAAGLLRYLHRPRGISGPQPPTAPGPRP